MGYVQNEQHGYRTPPLEHHSFEKKLCMTRTHVMKPWPTEEKQIVKYYALKINFKVNVGSAIKKPVHIRGPNATHPVSQYY
jgi:hypothetical protein